MKHATLMAVTVVLAATSITPARAACGDGCLGKIMNSYLTQLVRHDPSPLPVAADIRAIENGNDVKLGDGSWKSVTRVYDGQTFTDAQSGQVIHVAATQVNGSIASLYLRLKVVNGRITESEMFTKGGEPGFHGDFSGLLEPDTLYEADVPSARRSTRDGLIEIVNRYMDALGRHDGSLAPFSYRCDRYSAGTRFTNTGRPPEQGGGTCATSLDHLKGQAVVNRRIAVVDPRRGIVSALFIIPHGERTPPGATNVAELFKIVDGKIRSIDEFSFSGRYPPASGFSGQ